MCEVRQYNVLNKKTERTHQIFWWVCLLSICVSIISVGFSFIKVTE